MTARAKAIRDRGIFVTFDGGGGEQPPETGIGGVGNKRVTSKRDHRYQRQAGEACISCR